MYEILEHTADIGLKIKADSLESAFLDSARGLFDIMIEVKKETVPSIDIPIAIEAENLERLFISWLKELLLIFDTRRIVIKSFWFDEISDNRLIATVSGSKFDSAKHFQKIEIKAVAHHDMRFVRDSGSFSAQVLFEI